MLYYSILTDHLYVIVVRFMLLKLYIMYRYTKRLCGLLPFWSRMEHYCLPYKLGGFLTKAWDMGNYYLLPMLAVEICTQSTSRYY